MEKNPQKQWSTNYYTENLMIKLHEPHKNQDWAQMLLKGKKSLKIPKELSESVNQRTDNTMGKKTQKNNDLQNTTQKTNDQAPWTPQRPGLSSDALEDVRRVWRY